MAETRMTMTGAASRQGAGRRWTATRAPLTSRLAWRQCLVFLGLFFLPVSIALAQSTQQVIVSGSGVNYRTGSPNPNVWMGVESWSANNLDRLATIPDAGTVSDLRVSLDVAPGGGNSVTFTLRKDTGSGPVATALTCTISGPGANTTCSDTTNSVTVAAGDKLDILATPASNPTGSPVHYTTKYVSDTAKYTLLLGGSRQDPGITDLLSYVSLSGLWTSATEFNMETVFPTGGTLRNLYVELPAPPGAGASRTFTVRKNGVSTALTCTIAGAVATSCSDTTNTVSVAARDTAALLQTPSGSPVAAPRSNTAIVFEADTAGSFVIASGTESGAATGATNFGFVSGIQNLQVTEGQRDQLGQATTIKNMVVEVDTAPDNGAGVNGYQFTLRQNGADTGLLCLVGELATTCSAGLDVTIANDDQLSLEVTPINTPTAVTAFHVSFCAADRAGACPAIALAVELVSFTAVGLDGAVELQWETGAEMDNLGFHLYRSFSEQGPWERITVSLIPGLGSSPEGARYGYRDVGLVNGVAYFYRLEDVETTGKTELHGPVTAVPLSVSDPDPPAEEQGTEPGHEGTEPGHEKEGTEPGGGEEEGSEEGEGSSPAWMTYGDPESTSLRVVKRDERGVTLELLTGGFYAVPEPDGEVWLEIPGFENASEAGSPAIPVERSWVESVVGRKVRLDEVRAHDVVSFDSLRPVASGTPELVAEEDGTVRPVLRRRPKGKAFERPGLFPEQAARVVETAFQGETKKALVELSPLRWDRDTGQLLLARRLRVRVEFAGREPGERSRGGSRGRAYGGTRGTLSRRSAGVVARLSTRERGLYAVRFEELFGPGGRAVSSSKLRLSRQGEAVGFHLEPEGRGFSRGSVLYFVGEASTENPYGEAAVFEVSLEGGGARMPEESASPRGVSLGHYTHETRWEQDLKYQPGLVQAEDPWLWDALVSPATKAYPLAVSGLVSASEPARLRVWLEGGSDFAVSPDHHLRLSVNGYLVAETSWDGKASQEIEALLPPGVLLEGPNAFEIENVGDTGAAYSLVFLDRYALSYPRVLEAEGGVLEGGFSRFGAAEVTGLSSGAALLDVSQDPPRWLSGTWDTGLRFAAEAGHTYLAVSPEAVLAPEVRPATKATLQSPKNGAEYLLLAPRELLELDSAVALLERRRAQGLSARGVAVEDVFDEFGHGEARPEALKEFLAYAYHFWQEPSPRYVLLLGDATYDPKDHLGTGTANLVPAYPLASTYLWTASDPAYAAVNGEDLLPDLAIGRLPAQSAEQAQVLLDKVLAYEDAGLNLAGHAVLVADNPDHAGDFEADAEWLAAGVLRERDPEKIYLSQLGAATRPTIVDAFDRGASMMSYIGHGAILLWATENVFNSNDVATLSPQPQQPLVMMLNCLNGYFHFPYLDSLAEALVKAEGKGAIATFSPSGMSFNGPASVYHEALLAEIVSGRHHRLGDALLAAQVTYADHGAIPELLGLYHLFGDPALVIR